MPVLYLAISTGVGLEVDPIPVVVVVIFAVDTLVTPVPTFVLLKHVLNVLTVTPTFAAGVNLISKFDPFHSAPKVPIPVAL